jgi:serine/threonine-protein kinase
MVTIPTVTGMTRIEAQVLLEKEGFDVGDVSEAPSNAPRGTVIGTRPAAGSAISVPSTVGIILSAGAPAPSMPDVMGREVGAARQLLTQIGVRNVQIVRDPNGAGAPGTIVGQTPVGGTPIAAGMTVQLRVAGEPAIEPSPEPAPPPVQQP